MYANAGTPSVKIGILLNNSGTPIYNNFESIDDPDTVLLDSQVDTLTMTVSSNSDHRLSIDVTYSFTLDLIHPLSQDGKIEIVFPVGYDISLSVCTTNLPPRSAGSPISCSINLLVLTISNIKAIAANTSGITVIVDTV